MLKNICSALGGGVIVFVVMWAYWSDRVALCQKNMVSLTEDTEYVTTLEQLQHNLESFQQHNAALYADVARLESAYSESKDARDRLLQEVQRTEERSNRELAIANQRIAELQSQLKEVQSAKTDLQSSLKAQRDDYIALANKNAALERASIDELGKTHKNGTPMSSRDIPPFMRKVIEMSGIPDGRPVPRMAVR